MANSKLFNSLSAAAKDMIGKAEASITETATGIKNAFIIVGNDIVGTAGDVGKGIKGALTEANNIMADILDPLLVDQQEANIIVNRVKALAESAKTTVEANALQDAALQHVIIQTLTAAMADAQAALNSQFEENDRAALVEKFRASEQAITEETFSILQEVATKAASIKATVAAIKTAIYDAWRKQNPDSSGGMMLGQSALKGAKEANNNKYGDGSVAW